MPARQRGTPDMAGVGRRPDTALPSGPVADDRAYAAMIARAQALIPQLRERASRTEPLRRLPPETERDLHDAGLFRIVQPKRVGGAELDYVALVDCADALGQAGASAAGSVSPAGAGCRLGQDARCVARFFLHLSSRSREKGGWGICPSRSLAVLLGR